MSRRTPSSRPDRRPKRPPRPPLRRRRPPSTSVARFPFYKDAVECYTPDALVLLTDVRDVYFQRDPFPILQVRLGAGHDLFFMEEAPSNTFGWGGTENFNKRWIWSCWGEQAVARLANKTVLCAGTTMGTATGIRRYLKVMMQGIAERARSRDKAKYCPGWVKEECDCHSADQGYHNYLFYTGLFGRGTTSFRNGVGPVYTVGIMCNGAALPQNDRGMVLQQGIEGKQEVAAVVHQADRCVRPAGWITPTTKLETRGPGFLPLVLVCLVLLLCAACACRSRCRSGIARRTARSCRII